MPFVYMLRCADGSYYVGSARNLDNRMAQHLSGNGGDYTSKRMPVVLVFAQEFDRIDEAYFMEKRIQGWSRAKREALIEGRYNDLPRLSKKSFKPVE
ncbi:MAG: nuclease family protein [Rhodoglobus sp.]|jgi:putative endonuclease|nr:nuclease family protein [Rhodoglobus sp.]